MAFLIILSFMLSLVASLPGPPATKQSGGHKSYHDLKAQFNFSNWMLTDVTFDCRRPSTSVLFDCAFKFHWDDPNFNASASCDKPWKWDGVTMEQGVNNTYNNDEYFICEEHKEAPEAWQLKFYSMTNDGLFELGLVHDCIDEHDFNPAEFAEMSAAPFVQMKLVARDDYGIAYAAKEPVSVFVQGLTSSPMDNPPTSSDTRSRLVTRQGSLKRPS